MKPQLSIIIPCYNVQDYVHAALQSILNNTQPENHPRLELIIINDGATDQTPPSSPNLPSAAPSPPALSTKPTQAYPPPATQASPKRKANIICF